MEDFLSIAIKNILSPPILFFVLGIFAARVKSDLEIPAAIAKALSYYLLVVIGFKGGVELHMSAINFKLLYSLLAALFVAFVIPFIGYSLLRLTTKLDKVNAGAISAHYGSVSVVTFVAGVSFLGLYDIKYEGYVVAMMALMEAPAIISGLLLAKGIGDQKKGQTGTMFSPKLIQEILFGGTLLLLLGSFAIGWITGGRGMEALAGFIKVPFTGILCFFLLEMGILVGRKIGDIKKFGFPLILFGLYMPLLGAIIGALTGAIAGMSLGGTSLLAVLCASASYIVVPAALRHALPEANPSLSLPLALGVTFPLNIFIGIPLYYYCIKIVFEILKL
jgi:hypothetical protein